MTASIILRKGKEKPVRQRHPWVFAGAIQAVRGQPAAGEIVDIVAAGGEWLATAEFNPASQIRARIVSWEKDTAIDDDFWRARLQASIARRNQLLPDAEARRLVFAESDGLPGLIVDAYGDHVVVQFLTAGAEARREMTVAHLQELLSPVSITERDDPMRRKEDLPFRSGRIWGDLPEQPLTIREGRSRFVVDLNVGQKTGFYLDQAENRLALAAYCAGKEVLNAFSYTGGFGVHALAAGAAHVLNVDSSAEAL
ncbi:MAG: class I SAM-dependent rRNA methyltransferase, partial [Caldilineales bacterium]|nr:class I SAM-dependent rRNA methyltransferase [Caldilineales bacterium]